MKLTGTDLSRLKWFKFVNHPDKKTWSYSPQHLNTFSGEFKDLVIEKPGVMIFPLGFPDKDSRNPQAGDLMMLAQMGKVTHIVRILGNDFFLTSFQPVPYHRLVEVVWWQPDEVNWNENKLPASSEIVGTEFNLQGQRIFKLPDSSTALREYWEEHGGLTAFHAHVADALDKAK